MRARAGRRHLLSCKNSKRRRRLGTETELSKSDTKRVIMCLPYSR